MQIPESGLREMAAVEKIDQILARVRSEVLGAVRKFGSFAGPHEGYAVILEELDELWDEVKANRGRDPEAGGAEALQVAAMGVRYLLDVVKE